MCPNSGPRAKRTRYRSPTSDRMTTSTKHFIDRGARLESWAPWTLSIGRGSPRGIAALPLRCEYWAVWSLPIRQPYAFGEGALDGIELSNLSISETVDKVIVHHADRLHVRINDGRTDEAESPPLEILAERVGFE